MNLIDRRSLLQRALLLAGATLAPTFSIEALAQAAAEAPRLLDANRFALLTALAETIVPKTDTPGAAEVGVPKLIDGLLREWAAPAHRAELIAALDKVGALGGDFTKLTPARRQQLLAAHDAAALKPLPADEPAAPSLKTAPSVADPNYGKLKQESAEGKASATVVGEKDAEQGAPLARSRSPMMSGPPVADPDYAKLKELVVVLYYYSEPALTQELRYEHAPGAWEPSIPLTPETRPWGGFGFA